MTSVLDSGVWVEQTLAQRVLGTDDLLTAIPNISLISPDRMNRRYCLERAEHGLANTAWETATLAVAPQVQRCRSTADVVAFHAKLWRNVSCSGVPSRQRAANG